MIGAADVRDRPRVHGWAAAPNPLAPAPCRTAPASAAASWGGTAGASQAARSTSTVRPSGTCHRAVTPPAREHVYRAQTDNRHPPAWPRRPASPSPSAPQAPPHPSFCAARSASPSFLPPCPAGTTYQLETGKDNNTLHGGGIGYNKVDWEVEAVSLGEQTGANASWALFTYDSPDGEQVGQAGQAGHPAHGGGGGGRAGGGRGTAVEWLSSNAGLARVPCLQSAGSGGGGGGGGGHRRPPWPC